MSDTTVTKVSTAQKLYDIVRQKGSTIPLLVEGIQSEPHHKGILHSNFNFKNNFCFLQLQSYIGSHSISVDINCYCNGNSFKELIYVDGIKKESDSELLTEILEHFIRRVESNSLFPLY